MSKQLLKKYDKIIVLFSGGKDSIAIFLWLIHKGVDLSKVELWHHDIDGREGSTLMDWPVTRSYCKKFAEEFGVPIYFSWREGGFEREMLRDGTQATGDTHWESPRGMMKKESRFTSTVRRKFPQVGSIQSGRWCSAKLKIDVYRTVMNNDPRLKDLNILVLSGERAAESKNRSKYFPYEPDELQKKRKAQFEKIMDDTEIDREKVSLEACMEVMDYGVNNPGRIIDRLRPVKYFSNQKVWDIMRYYGVRPHPAYELGWGRLSCKKCIFGNYDQWASCYVVDPEGTTKIMDYEDEFGMTIKREESVRDQVSKGKPYAAIKPELVKLAMSDNYTETIIIGKEKWVQPEGAEASQCGPS